MAQTPINEKLQKALDAGILTEDQLHKIENIDDPVLAKEDEAFQIFGGFNEILITLGVIIFFMALSWFSKEAVIIAALAGTYFFTKVHKLTFPSIVLAIFLFSALFGVIARFLTDGQSMSFFYIWIAFSVGIMAYYLYFKLPFALSVIALTFTTTVMIGYAVLFQGDVYQRFEFTLMPYRILLFICGAVVFIAALSFDQRDPARETVNTQKAFWLHIVAAPMMVWPWMIGVVSGGDLAQMAIAFIVIVILALIGLVLDRRSFLTAGLLSLIILIYYILRMEGGSALEIFKTFRTSLLVVGVYVLVMGIFWRPIRKMVFRILPKGAWRDKLPVVK